MSASSTERAAVYAGFPLPLRSSRSCTPPSSLYCTQKSVSRISTAAANLSRAASPRVSRPPRSSGPLSASAAAPLARSPTPVLAIVAAVSPFFRNERRLIAFFVLLHVSVIEPPCSSELEPVSVAVCQQVVSGRSRGCHSIVERYMVKKTITRRRASVHRILKQWQFYSLMCFRIQFWQGF